MYKNTFFASLTSIVLHLVALLLVGFCFDLTPKVALLGDPETAVVSSYVYQQEQASVKSVSNPPATVKKLITKKVDLALKASNDTQKRNEQTTKTDSQSTPLAGKSHGEAMNALLALLHTSIQEHQQYPPSALQMEREGRVTVGFILMLDGTISALRVLASSGADSLDNAALLAVREAVPFRHIDQYISASQEYKIDVVFKLT